MATDRMVTLLMTDLEGSTAKWERAPSAMRAAMLRHDEIASSIVHAHDGRLVKSRGEGDSLFAVFADPLYALDAAEAIHRALAEEEWEGGLRMATRIAVHSGAVAEVDQDIYGPTVNRCARLRGIGHGGQTLVSRSTHALVNTRLGETVRLRDLGTHRLRDLQEPERVFQYEIGATRHFPPLRSLDARPNNLPLQLTSFLGREEEISAVQQALRISRLVTLVGPGGCGKTRLAIQVGAEHRDPFPDGIWFVELATHDSEAAICAAIAEAVGGDPRNADPLAAIEAIPEALLVLDNAEHAVTNVSRIASRILARVTKIRILATSREPLKIAGEAIVRVDPMPLPPPDATIEEAVQSSAVQLFVERASSRADSFAISAANHTEIVRICRRLEGIPLAIEQAASIAPYLSATEIANRLEETFEVLESDEAGVAPRHRTLEATIGWSYGLLAPDEQTLFKRLSVFPSSFSVAAVEEVCADEEIERRKVFRLLRCLVDKSLVSRTAAQEGFEARLRMMDIVAEYARNRLGPDVDVLNARLFDWAHRMLVEASRNPLGSGDPVWSRRLEGDDQNLRRAIDVGFERERPEVVEMVFHMRHYWLRKGHIGLGRTYLAKAQSQGKGVLPAQDASLLNTLGAFAWRANELDEAQRYYEASLRIQRQLGDSAGAASVLNNLGILASDRRDHEAALRWYDAALTEIDGGDYPNIARLTRVNCAMTLLDLNRLEEAESEMRIALLLSQESSASATVAFLNASLADIAIRFGRWESALDLMEAAFHIWSEEVDLFVMAEAMVDISKLALHVGDSDTAVRCLGYFMGVLRSTETRPKFRAEAKLSKVREELGDIVIIPISPRKDLPQRVLAILSNIRSRLSTSVGSSGML